METSANLSSHVIPLSDAIEMTKRFRENREHLLADEYKGLDVLPFSETFPKSAIKSLFENPNCDYVRIYFGLDDQMKLHSILVGADASDNDLLPEATGEGDGVILEDAVRCPHTCPPASALNTD